MKTESIQDNEMLDEADAELDALKEERKAMMEEIKSILDLLDGVARQWGDEGVFRRCRDRLRNLIESPASTNGYHSNAADQQRRKQT